MDFRTGMLDSYVIIYLAPKVKFPFPKKSGPRKWAERGWRGETGKRIGGKWFPQGRDTAR
jgi:hypothetical protein